MNREEFLLRMKNITNMYSMPFRVENMQPIHYACREYDKLAYEQQKEIERLNNIINELEKYLENRNSFFKEMSRDYGTHHDLLDENENILDKLKELKESGNNG